MITVYILNLPYLILVEKFHPVSTMALKEPAKKKQKLNPITTIDEIDEFWLLFRNRRYRSSNEFIRWDIHISALFHCQNEDNDLNDNEIFDPYNGLDGFLLKDLHSMYLKYKNKLKQQQIEEFDSFFDGYQYGDGVDCVGMRNVGLYLIGYSTLDNVNGQELKFLKTWREYGEGIPIEFGDAPIDYFDDDSYSPLKQLFDPLRMILNKDQKENDDLYYYAQIMQEIEDRKVNPNSGWHNFERQAVELNKFPNGYIALFDGLEDQFEWIRRDRFAENTTFDIHSMLESNMKVYEWTKTFDFAVEKRKKRIEDCAYSVHCLLPPNLVKEILTFVL